MCSYMQQNWAWDLHNLAVGELKQNLILTFVHTYMHMYVHEVLARNQKIKIHYSEF